jgi:hypothetical protein
MRGNQSVQEPVHQLTADIADKVAVTIAKAVGIAGVTYKLADRLAGP